MQISCPIKKTVWGSVNSVDDLKKHITKSGQFFGQDLSGPACEWNKDYPCDKTFYAYMGWGSHKGLDIPIATGTEVFASHSGKVLKLSDSLTAGIGVVLLSEDEKMETVYWHLLSYNVVVGQQVKVGDLIALSDDTGYSKGAHLHFEQKLWDGNKYTAIDPLPNITFDMEKLTKKQVERLQALEGFKDQQGVEYWTGKELDQYLVARIPDKISDLTKALNDS